MTTFQNSLCHYNNAVHGLCNILFTLTSTGANKICETPFSIMQCNSTTPQCEQKLNITSIIQEEES